MPFEFKTFPEGLMVLRELKLVSFGAVDSSKIARAPTRAGPVRGLAVSVMLFIGITCVPL